MTDIATHTSRLLNRTNLSNSFSEFLANVEMYYQIGKITNVTPINQGYEHANFILNTNKNKYLLKVISKQYAYSYILDFVKSIEKALEIGVPVAKLEKGSKGALFSYSKDRKTTYALLEDFFEGNDFRNTTPTLNDIRTIAGYLANFNTLNFPITEDYDPWGNINLVKEYNKNKSRLDTYQEKTILPIVETFQKLNYQGFKKGVIHGDLQRKHVLKNKQGKYCILDFGCVTNDLVVIDISTYLAWFCLQRDTWKNRRRIYDVVLKEYTKIHVLTTAELKSIPILVKASYAAYFMKTSVLIRNGDTSTETLEWHSLSREMLQLSKDWG